MAVYVDNANIAASVPNGSRVHTSRWCHLMADTLPELEAFARRLRMSPSWLQMKRSGVHYDLTAGKRRQAVALGAVEIETRTEEWRRVVAAARQQYIEALIERGSLGTPEAKRLRESVPQEAVDRILARVCELEAEETEDAN